MLLGARRWVEGWRFDWASPDFFTRRRHWAADLAQISPWQSRVSQTCSCSTQSFHGLQILHHTHLWPSAEHGHRWVITISSSLDFLRWAGHQLNSHMPGQRGAPCQRLGHYSEFYDLMIHLKHVMIISIRQQRRQCHWLRPLRPRGLEKDKPCSFLTKYVVIISYMSSRLLFWSTHFLGHPNPPPPFPSTSDPHYDSASSCQETFSHLHNHSYF